MYCQIDQKMKILIHNQASIPNKYIRFIKWKLYKLARIYDKLVYFELYIQEEGSNPKEYIAKYKVGVPGNDIIFKSKSDSLRQLFSESSKQLRHRLKKHKAKQIEISRS